MLLRDFVEEAGSSLSAIYDRREASAAVDILCRHFFGVRGYECVVRPDFAPDVRAAAGARAALNRMLAGEPLQYVLGTACFCGRDFNVTPSVLIPRPETEMLCVEAVRAVSAISGRKRILDLCTGSGCIAWTMALEVSDAEVFAVDISEDALAVAISQPFDPSRSPHFVKADIFDDAALFSVAGGEGFDLIVGNPPYVLESEKRAMRSNVLEHEPALALFVPDADPMVFNRKIAEICKNFLYTDAVAFFEINEALGGAVKAVFDDAGLRKTEILRDLSDRDRFIKLTK